MSLPESTLPTVTQPVVIAAFVQASTVKVSPTGAFDELVVTLIEPADAP